MNRVDCLAAPSSVHALESVMQTRQNFTDQYQDCCSIVWGRCCHKSCTTSTVRHANAINWTPTTQ